MKIIQSFLRNAYQLSSRTRARFWSLFVKKMGKNVLIGESTVIANPGTVEIGSNVLISRYCNIQGARGWTKIGDNVEINRCCWISGDGNISIGNNVMIGPNCNIISSVHNYDRLDIPMTEQGSKDGPITVEEDVWLGANVVVLPNIMIGKGAVVGANAVVTKNVEPYSIMGGVPAKLIKYRPNTDGHKNV